LRSSRLWKLPAGGEEPGKAFLEYGNALMKRDVKAARKHLTGKFKGPDEQIQLRLEVDAKNTASGAWRGRRRATGRQNSVHRPGV
jgi:hypothetical protein